MAGCRRTESRHFRSSTPGPTFGAVLRTGDPGCADTQIAGQTGLLLSGLLRASRRPGPCERNVRATSVQSRLLRRSLRPGGAGVRRARTRAPVARPQRACRRRQRRRLHPCRSGSALTGRRAALGPLSCMDTSSQRVAAALPRGSSGPPGRFRLRLESRSLRCAPVARRRRISRLGAMEGHTRGMPVPQPDYELRQFFDLSPDLLCIAGVDGYFQAVQPIVRARAGLLER